MHLDKEPKYSYSDIAVVPSSISRVRHRSECLTRPLDPIGDEIDNPLPIFAAPMSTIVDIDSYSRFKKNGISPILPRNIDLSTRLEYAKNGDWAAFSLDEFIDEFVKKEAKPSAGSHVMRVLVDVANGHMSMLIETCKAAKEKYGHQLKIMAGNVANPATYRAYADAKIDYIRVGVGGGSGCITSTQTAIHYPMASLVYDIASLRHIRRDGMKYMNDPKIVADGGIRNYSDLVKALALGADYVMIGGLFATCAEAAGKLYTKGRKLDQYLFDRYENIRKDENGHWVGDYKQEFYDKHFGILENKPEKTKALGKIYREFYGMASKKGQRDMKMSDLDPEKRKRIETLPMKFHTAEGIAKEIEVTQTLAKWSENMRDYLRSAMSYCNAMTLDEFKENAKCIVLSEGAKSAINK